MAELRDVERLGLREGYEQLVVRLFGVLAAAPADEFEEAVARFRKGLVAGRSAYVAALSVIDAH